MLFASLASLALAALSSADVLVNFQVAEPPPVPRHARTCTIKVLEHTFGNSYYRPAIAEYTPPTDCGEPGSWSAVTLNFTVTSRGRQYDRLAVFTLHHTEIWRTSTPEPTPEGIVWTHSKDVTRYVPLFAKPGDFILELDNIVDGSLTGKYAATLHATFYMASDERPTARQSNLIVPISTMSDTLANHASVPPAFSLTVTLPRNTIEIYAELYASGNGKEEFWYSNIVDEHLHDVPPDTTYPGGPFREVRLLVDGKVAGVAFPFPVIFTGGFNPAVWRPITAYGAIDLPTYFLDLTPFVPVFADGLPHVVTIDVVSAESTHHINENWFVSGLLQVITDPSGEPTTGRMLVYDVEPYATTHISGSVNPSEVVVTVEAERHVFIESVVVSGSGVENYVAFRQDLFYANTQLYGDDATVQTVNQISSGSVSSVHNDVSVVTDDFTYPLYVDVTNLDGSTFYTTFDHSYERHLSPAPFVLGSTISVRQRGSGSVTCPHSVCFFGRGTNNNTFSYVDDEGDTFFRKVDAESNRIVFDQQSGSLADGFVGTSSWQQVPSSSSSSWYPARLPGGRRL